MINADNNMNPGYFGRTQPELFKMDRFYERLEEIGIPMEFPKNHLLYNAGELPDSCYYVKEGRIISFEYTYTGQQHIFGSIEPGEFILLPSIILGHRVTLNFATALPSKLVRIHRQSLLEAISSDPDFALCTVYILSAKFVVVNERFRAESSKAVSWKLCNLLLSLADQHGVEYDGKTLIEMKYSQQNMADFLHVNRTTIARAIKELTCLGLLERINDFYCIRNIDKLRIYMDDINNIQA